MGVNTAQIELFPGFAHSTVPVGDAGDNIVIHCAHGGDGPPLLLLHGYPQTHVIWHKVAQQLAERYTVVCADLRGYGDSSKPPGLPDHGNYSKRVMALDQVRLMEAFGFTRFAVVGHDRGGRVAHRMARDHRERVSRLCVLDISPTLTMYEQTDMAFAQAYYHWFFLIQPAPQARDVDRARSEVLFALEDRWLGEQRPCSFRARRVRGIRALLFRPCGHPCDVRGLSRRGKHRSRT